MEEKEEEEDFAATPKKETDSYIATHTTAAFQDTHTQKRTRYLPTHQQPLISGGRQPACFLTTSTTKPTTTYKDFGHDDDD